ncbi:hypothetical protein IKE67_03500 [bacterium]|nr:hypothetical protein [bacterium]
MKNFILTLLTIFFASCNVLAHECNSSTECAIMGKKLIEQKEYKNAIECFTKAIEMDENEYFSYAFRAKANYYLKNYEQTIKDADKSIEINPNSVAYGIKSSVNLLKGNYNDAINNSTKALELNPQYMKCYEVRARAELATENYVDALKDSTKAINLRNDYAKSYEVRAKAYAGIKDYISATQDCEKAAALFKNNHDRKNARQMKKLAKCYKGKIK